MDFKTSKSVPANPLPEKTADEVPCCWVYASSKHVEMYLYLASESGFAAVPVALLQRFGKPRLVMQLQLAQQGNLARESIHKVRHNLQSQGYHLQLPPQLIPVMNHGE